MKKPVVKFRLTNYCEETKMKTATEATTETLALAQRLIDIPSVTPKDNGCQALLCEYLQAMGFRIEILDSGNVKNLWAIRGQAQPQPLLAFSAHTDVVAPGLENNWKSPPFTATLRDGFLYGRGAADMKGALAAMIIACKKFLNKYPNHKGSIGFMITSDEEGDALDGTAKIVEYLKQQKIKIDWCLIGEASSNQEVGDAIKIGRRGSLHGELQVIGKQGHIAYPQFAENPIHRSLKALDALTKIEWDQGNESFPATSLQIYNINADTGASNIIPGSLTAKINFRFSPASTVEQLKKAVHEIFDAHNLHYQIHWKLTGNPFLSKPDRLTQVCQQAIQTVCKLKTQINTSGGTSDGRFIADLGCEIVELGASGESSHQVNEHIKIEDLDKLTSLYENILEQLLIS